MKLLIQTKVASCCIFSDVSLMMHFVVVSLSQNKTVSLPAGKKRFVIAILSLLPDLKETNH